MRHRECPHCGQTLPPEFRVALTRDQERLFDRVRRAGKHGVPVDVLYDFMYAHDADGGPDSGVRSLYVRINHLNKTKLKAAGWRIRALGAGGPGSYSNYVLEKI